MFSLSRLLAGKSICLGDPCGKDNQASRLGRKSRILHRSCTKTASNSWSCSKFTRGRGSNIRLFDLHVVLITIFNSTTSNFEVEAHFLGNFLTFLCIFRLKLLSILSLFVFS